jgi:hypothetical protein
MHDGFEPLRYLDAFSLRPQLYVLDGLCERLRTMRVPQVESDAEVPCRDPTKVCGHPYRRQIRSQVF